MKKFLSILLVVVMAAAMFALPASAERVTGDIPKVTTAPTVDGVKDDAYAQGLKLSGTNWIKKNADKPADLAFDAYFLHDDDYVYIFIDIKDSSKATDNDNVNTAFNNRSDTDGVHLLVYTAEGASATTNLYKGINTIYFNRTTQDDLYLTQANVKSKVALGQGGNWSVELRIGKEEHLCGTNFLVELAYIDQPTTNTKDMGTGGTRNGVLTLSQTTGWNYKSDEACKLNFSTTVVGGNTNTGNTGNTGNTNTGDNTVAFVGLALVSAIALAGVQLSKKRV